MHVIGTAGHVDHGKSTLVQALTGIDPDRLREEKEREMTIDLGFAWLQLGGEEVGVIDVPGHRDFIENMLAGVGGIDLALFVIAADEGVMPQTREHLAILDLLEVRRGVVALTKVDLVDDPGWLELVELEIGEALEGTALADAPIIPVSARTGRGIAELKATLADLLEQTESRADIGRPRLPIDRVFTLSGFGTVVTGTLLDGSFRTGDEVEIQPGGLRARIRGLQTHRARRDVVQPGSRVAINIPGVDRDALRRGQQVAAPGVARPTRLIDTQYRHLDDAGAPLTHNMEVKLFIGAAEMTAHARVIGREAIAPGETGWLQLALQDEIAAARGDRFILRRPSPGATLGGGRVLDAHPGRRHRRFRPDVVARFETLSGGTPEELLLQALARSEPAAAAQALKSAGLEGDTGRAALQRLLDEGLAVEIGRQLMRSATWDTLQARAVAVVDDYHSEYPLRLGIDREEVRSRLRLAPPVFLALAQALSDRGEVVEAGTLLRRPSHEVRFTPEQQARVDRLIRSLDEAGVNSPSVKECKAVVGDDIYFALVDLGRLRPLSEDVVYSAAVYKRVLGQITEFLHARGSISAAEARDVLGTSRKYAIALLEHLDDLHVTRRVGDTRELVRTRSAM